MTKLPEKLCRNRARFTQNPRSPGPREMPASSRSQYPLNRPDFCCFVNNIVELALNFDLPVSTSLIASLAAPAKLKPHELCAEGK
jgi:hypothetical protein